LKVWPPYTCKLLQKGEANDEVAQRVYPFDASKVDQIFDMLLKDI